MRVVVVVVVTYAIRGGDNRGFTGGNRTSRSAIDSSRSGASLPPKAARPTSLRDECPAGSGILQVNYSLQWVARRGVGGTRTTGVHLPPVDICPPCASSAGVKLRGERVRARAHACVFVYARILVKFSLSSVRRSRETVNFRGTDCCRRTTGTTSYDRRTPFASCGFNRTNV